MITIDWASLGQVVAVSIVATVAFVILLSGGIRFVSFSRLRTEGHAPGRTAALVAGYALLGLAGVLVLYGIYLIVPLAD